MIKYIDTWFEEKDTFIFLSEPKKDIMLCKNYTTAVKARLISRNSVVRTTTLTSVDIPWVMEVSTDLNWYAMFLFGKNE